MTGSVKLISATSNAERHIAYYACTSNLKNKFNNSSMLY